LFFDKRGGEVTFMSKTTWVPYVVFLIFFGLSSLCANADEIYLKDGTVVKGKILESKDNVSYKILTTGGSEVVYTVDQVSKVKITDASPNEAVTPDSIKPIDQIDQGVAKPEEGQSTSSSQPGFDWGGHGWSRAGKGEWGFFIQKWNGGESSYTESGIHIDAKFDDANIFGVEFGSNINDHVNYHMDIYYGSLPSTAYGNGKSVESTGSVLGWGLNLELYLLKERITPLVSVGVGFVDFFGDVEGLSFNEYDFTYNYGVGVRWDVTDHLLIKALYKTTNVTLKDAEKASKFNGLSASIDFRN
jgi:opacity protein-like surface antigen